MTIPASSLLIQYIFTSRKARIQQCIQGKRIPLIGIIIFAVLFSNPFFIHPTILFATKTTAVN